MAGEQLRIGDREHRRRIDDHEVLPRELLDQLLHAARAEQLGGVRRDLPGREQGQQRDGRRLGDVLEAHRGGEQLGQAHLAVHGELLGDHRAAQVRVDQQRGLAGAGHDAGEVRGDGGLALTGSGGGHHDRAGRVVHVDVAQIRAQLAQRLAAREGRGLGQHAVLAAGELLRVRERAEGGQAHHVGDVVGGAQAAVVAVPQPGEAQRHQQTEGGAGEQELLAVRGDGGAGHDGVLVIGQLHADGGVLVPAGLEGAGLGGGRLDGGVRDRGGLLRGGRDGLDGDDRGVGVQGGLQGAGDLVGARLETQLVHDPLTHRAGVEQRQVGLGLLVLEGHVPAGLLDRVAVLVGLRAGGDVAERARGVGGALREGEPVAGGGTEHEAGDEEQEVAQQQPEEVFDRHRNSSSEVIRGGLVILGETCTQPPEMSSRPRHEPALRRRLCRCSPAGRRTSIGRAAGFTSCPVRYALQHLGMSSSHQRG